MNEPTLGVMRAPRHLVVGPGQRYTLSSYVLKFGRRALLITDARMAQDAAFLNMVDDLKKHDVAVRVFDGVAAELPLFCIEAGLHSAVGFEASVIVGLGGGSCLDAAKVIATVLAHGGAPADYYGEYQVPGPILPLILMPTTSGTGSEVTPVAVIDDPLKAQKIGIASPYLIPEVAICDAELTLTCPPGLTAASGADALTHAIEAFTTLQRPAHPRLTTDHVFIGKNALADHFALEAIRLISQNLEECVERGDNLARRHDLMVGSTLAGLAFGVAGTAAAHAIQYPIGAQTKTAHGLGVATLLPYVMTWNSPACREQIARIGEAMGLSVSGGIEERAKAAVDHVADLFAKIGIPKSIAALGVTEDQLDGIADTAMRIDRLIKNNPRKLDAAGMTQVVRAAFLGDRSLLA